MLSEVGLSRQQLSSFVLHPGGRKILAALESALQIARPQMQPSWDILRDNGNVSSAAVLFVLDRWLRRHRPPAAVPAIECGADGGRERSDATMIDCRETSERLAPYADRALAVGEDALRRAAYRALDEEAILVAVHRVRHSE